MRKPLVFRSQRIDSLKPAIRGRDEWGSDLAVGPLAPEEDVRFLLVHHTASPNDYGQEDVIPTLRGFHRFHTGPEKGWPDLAYNFTIDRFGDIWEGRQGSIAGPVRGDATGGSQGFAILCSLIGNYADAPVSDPAQASLVALLAWLAETYQIDTAPGATVDFVSRGSNRWSAGETVTARTISGHREMSKTACPGDLAFGLLDSIIPQAVTDVRDSIAMQTGEETEQQAEDEPKEEAETEELEADTTTTSESQSSTSNSSSTSRPQIELDSSSTTTATTEKTQTEAMPTQDALRPPGQEEVGSDIRPAIPIVGGAVAFLAATVGAIIRFRRRTLPIEDKPRTDR